MSETTAVVLQTPEKLSEQAQLRTSAIVQAAQVATMQMVAKTLNVVDEESYQSAVEWRNKAASIERDINNVWDPLCKWGNQLHKYLTGQRKSASEAFTQIKEALTSKAEKYLLEQKRQRELAERELARAASQERTKLEGEADDLMARGFVREAQAKLQEADIMTSAPPVLADAIPQAENARVSEGYEAACHDPIALMRAIVEGKVPFLHVVRGQEEPLMLVNQKVLNELVKRKGKSLHYPGVSVKDKVSLGAKRL